MLAKHIMCCIQQYTGTTRFAAVFWFAVSAHAPTERTQHQEPEPMQARIITFLIMAQLTCCAWVQCTQPGRTLDTSLSIDWASFGFQHGWSDINMDGSSASLTGPWVPGSLTNTFTVGHSPVPQPAHFSGTALIASACECCHMLMAGRWHCCHSCRLKQGFSCCGACSLDPGLSRRVDVVVRDYAALLLDCPCIASMTLEYADRWEWREGLTVCVS